MWAQLGLPEAESGSLPWGSTLKSHLSCCDLRLFLLLSCLGTSHRARQVVYVQHSLAKLGEVTGLCFSRSPVQCRKPKVC